MSKHAVLGATGATGSAVLRALLASSTRLQISIFVRSESKLHDKFPDLQSNNKHDIRIIPGSLSDTSALADCLNDADVIYSCIATNISTKNVNIAQSAAETTIAALRKLQTDKSDKYKPPLLIFNRSELINPALPSGAPGFLIAIPTFALGYLMRDLQNACKLYATAANENPPLLSYILVDPPGLHDADRVEGTGYEFVRQGKLQPALNYADLGAAMVELAGKAGEEYRNQAVGVSATGEVKESFGNLFGFLLQGLRSRLSPF
jgi:hypothetical protein